jgi:hypothetical protein
MKDLNDADHHILACQIRNIEHINMTFLSEN